MVTSRVWFTAQQKAELWERWRNGLSVAAISRVFDRRNKTGVLRIVTHPIPANQTRRDKEINALNTSQSRVSTWVISGHIWYRTPSQ
jgi:hypothetical protein